MFIVSFMGAIPLGTVGANGFRFYQSVLATTGMSYWMATRLQRCKKTLGTIDGLEEN